MGRVLRWCGKVLMAWGWYCDGVERFYWCEEGTVMTSGGNNDGVEKVLTV